MTVEMAVAAQYLIPHSAFLDWSKPDRDKAIAWFLRQRAACPSCHTRPEEWDETLGGDRDAYIAVHERCRGCEIKERGESTQPKDAGRGVSTVLKPNPKVGRRG